MMALPANLVYLHFDEPPLLCKRMSTPAMAFGAGLRNILASLWMVWCLTFVISRIFLLHDAYISESNRRADERWLLERCREPEFYSNLRQHTDLCTAVEKNARSSLFLTALNSVASKTHACGTTSCLDLVFTIFSRLGWHAGLLLLAAMLVAPNFLYMLMLQVQQHVRKRSRKRPHAYSALLEEEEDCEDSEEAHALMALRTRWLNSSSSSSKESSSSSSNNVKKRFVVPPGHGGNAVKLV